MLKQTKKDFLDSYKARALEDYSSDLNVDDLSVDNCAFAMFHPIIAIIFYIGIQTTRFSVSYIKDTIREINTMEKTCHEDIKILSLLVNELYKLGCFSAYRDHKDNYLKLVKEDISIANIYNFYMKNQKAEMLECNLANMDSELEVAFK